MKKIAIYFVLIVLLLVAGLSGCSSPAADDSNSDTDISDEFNGSNSDITDPTIVNEHFDSIVDIGELAAIIGVDNYNYSELEEANTVGGRFWTMTSAMFSIEFRIHPGGGMDLFEDYRTAANPDSRVWLESNLWDTCIYYEIGEYDGEILALVGEDCYVVSFVPSAYPDWDSAELGVGLMELLIRNQGV